MCTHVHLHASMCIIYAVYIVQEDILCQMYVDTVRLTQRSQG